MLDHLFTLRLEILGSPVTMYFIILYDSVSCTISLKVRKIYYIMFNSDLYYKSTLRSYIYAIKVPKKLYLYFKSIHINDIFNC